ncbi:repressible alkaline phosphatase precursor [Trichoderma arundinaceum]|uniref:Alkaline phosphatase n=1 Tax=Trichoderma arundinaceum TaxID=490622 RepID=A0A395NR64_TRIAR|nr:repressible alkaline phosphatase precursor [Trichoderma arundinaceum]
MVSLGDSPSLGSARAVATAKLTQTNQSSERSPLLSSGGEASEPPQQKTGFRSSRVREIAFFAWGLLATAAFIVAAVWIQHGAQTDHSKVAAKRNLVFMVSDGMGPAPLSLTRSYRQYINNLPEGDTLVLDQHFWGTSRTRSSNSLVTDSAAGATAFSCGLKSYNGAISVLPDLEPCGSVMEAAKRKGYTTGLVVTTDITDATPACFVSHVLKREMQDSIALQEVGEGVLGRSVDLMLGGGRCHFLPNTTEGGCRADDVDVTRLAQEKHGWTYANDRKGFDALEGGNKVKLPFLGLFAERDVPFEIDRQKKNDMYPSLSEMATAALRALEKETKNSDKGFFLMIEGSRIDHAGHYNDPAAQVREVLEFDKTFKAVLDFIASSKTETVLVSTSDHETGGLALALQEPGHLPVYNWYPRALANASSSAEFLASELRTYAASTTSSRADLKRWINEELVIPGLGISNASDDELSALADNAEAAVEVFSAIISLRAHVGWSTHGHTAVDVNIYSSGGPGTEKIRGNVENTDVGKFLRNYLDVDVDEITKELREKTEKPGAAAQSMLAEQRGAVESYHVQEKA